MFPLEEAALDEVGDQLLVQELLHLLLALVERLDFPFFIMLFQIFDVDRFLFDVHGHLRVKHHLASLVSSLQVVGPKIKSVLRSIPVGLAETRAELLHDRVVMVDGRLLPLDEVSVLAAEDVLLHRAHDVSVHPVLESNGAEVHITL